ncbi:MAG: alkaline phosphatase D family protein [Bacteroidota bacterium]|nr:alkaline phosphatase D family protein [Bacteroidota bacterium]
MSGRRKFIKEVSLASATMAISLKGNSNSFPFNLWGNNQGPHMATGLKIGEVSDTQAIIWARLTKNSARVSDDAPEPTILYKNGKTGIFEHKGNKDSRPDREPKVEYPQGIDVNTIAGAVPAAPGEVRVRWKAENESNWQSSSWQAVNLEQDSVSQFILKNLTPAKKYDVKVEARSSGGNAASSTLNGIFKTAPAKTEQAGIKFMVVTCQEYHDRDYGSKGFKIYESMLRQQPDFFVHTGDIVYYDQQAKNLALARWHWQRMYSFPTLVEFHKQIPSYFMKDDHDTWMNDCWPEMQTKFMGDFTFKQGQQLFLDQVPMGDKTYRTFRWGKDLQIWLVEGRDFRSPNLMPDGPDKTIWGKEQIEWFKNTVEASDATFKILISQTPIVGPDRPQKKDNLSNKVFYHEGEMLRKYIQQQPNMHIVNGDRHWQYASRDPETGLLEFSCGPASNEHAGGWKKGDVKLQELYLQVIGGYLEVEVKRKGNQPVIVFSHHDVDGNVVYQYEQYASGQY